MCHHSNQGDSLSQAPAVRVFWQFQYEVTCLGMTFIPQLGDHLSGVHTIRKTLKARLVPGPSSGSNTRHVLRAHFSKCLRARVSPS